MRRCLEPLKAFSGDVEKLPIIPHLDASIQGLAKQLLCHCSFELRNSGRYVVSQPRRLAAEAVASRLAGCRHRDSTLEPNAQLDVIVSTEHYVLRDLVRRLAGETTTDFGVVSLYFLDEVHELTDTMLQILAMLRRFPPSHQNFGVVIMSATGPSQLFANYFGLSSPVVVEVPMLGADRLSCIEQDASELLNDAIKYTQLGNTCLIFCASVPHTEQVRLALRKALPQSDYSSIRVLHGLLSPDAQTSAITPPAANERRFVCSTSIAETSLTIRQLQVVIDFRLMQAKLFYPLANQAMLTRVETPKDRWMQRKGRIGREKQDFDMFYVWARHSGAICYESDALVCNRDWTDTLMQLGDAGVGLEELLYQPPPLHEARMRENLSRYGLINYAETPDSSWKPEYSKLLGYSYPRYSGCYFQRAKLHGSVGHVSCFVRWNVVTSRFANVYCGCVGHFRSWEFGAPRAKLHP